MRILINSINYAPELVGIGKYTSEMAEWLSQQGHDVTVVAAPPYYPEWSIGKGYSAVWYKTENMNDVTVVRCPLWVPSKPTGLKRLIYLGSFAITSFFIMLWKSLTTKPDIIFVVEPPFFCAPAALIGAFLARGRSWIHVQDFEIDAAFSLGMLKSERVRKWTLSAESWMLKRFDTASTISQRMIDRLRDKGVAEENIVLLENWVEIDQIRPLDHDPPLRRQLDLPTNKSIILYSGNMGEKQGLEIIVEAARTLSQRDDIFFMLCGAGSSKDRLIKSSKELKNIGFFPLQPVGKLNELLNIADVHLLPQRAGAEDLVMPSKLTNMMASGKPVVATVATNTQVAKVVHDCGIVVPPEDRAAFCEAILSLVDDKALAEHYGRQGRLYAEANWDKDKVLSAVFQDSMLRKHDDE